MKRLFTDILPTIITLVMVFMVAWIAVAQESKPVVHRLNPAASVKWIELDKAHQDIIREANRQLSEIANQQAALKLGAGIPAEYTPQRNGDTIEFVKPSPSPVPSPK